MGDVIHSDRLADRAADTFVRRFWDECRALERDGKLDDRDVLAFGRANPTSAIRAMLDEPGDASGPDFLSTLQRAWRGRRMTKQKDAEIDRLDECFHDVAAKLADALAQAHSPQCPDGQVREAFGRCVTLARELVETDAKLVPLGEAHETGQSAPANK